MAPYYPVYLDVKNRLCVIIGGGPIGEGKIAALLECGANIRMICPEVTQDVKDMADTGVINLEQREYREGDLEGAFVVIAATDDNTVNRRIADEAERLGVLLNVADVTHLCNFIAPSVVRKGEVTVAISTAGVSPALARKLRETLEVSRDLDFADMASLLGEVRGELRSEGVVVHPDHWQTCLTQDLLSLFYRDRDAARSKLKESLLQDPAPRGGERRMRVFALGLSHKTAPIAVREKAAFTRAEMPEALRALKDTLDNAVILSTCNRTELYAVAEEADAVREAFISLLGEKTSWAEEELSGYLAFYEQEQAIRHLFEVASGLDSQILGESQVLGQVREAYSAAVTQGCASGLISKVFHHSLRVGKRARRETRIGENALSISSAAVEAARDTLGDLSHSQVAVIGAGEAGKLVARAMKDRGVGRMTVVNRTLERARDLALELEAESAPLDRLPELLGEVDIVVSSTDYQGVMITTDPGGASEIAAQRQPPPGGGHSHTS